MCLSCFIFTDIIEKSVPHPQEVGVSAEEMYNSEFLNWRYF